MPMVVQLVNLRIPPTIALLLGVFVGLAIGGISAYYIVTERLDAELANVEKDTVIDGEKKAAIIRKETEKAKAQTQQLKEKVKNGEQSIIAPGGKHFTDSFVTSLQSKIDRARALSD